MRIKYVGSHDAVDVPGVGTVEQGKSVEVSAALGKSLLEQETNWQQGERTLDPSDRESIGKATIAELKALAKAQDIDLADLKKKSDIAAAIVTHLDKNGA